MMGFVIGGGGVVVEIVIVGDVMGWDPFSGSWYGDGW